MDRNSREYAESMGHEKKNLMRVIRDKCTDCCCGSYKEIDACASVACALWPYRNGDNPFRAPLSEKQMENARKRGEVMRAARENLQDADSDE